MYIIIQGNGKNLVAIGPKKYRDPLWHKQSNCHSDSVDHTKSTSIEEEEGTVVLSYHSPFSFSFHGL